MLAALAVAALVSVVKPANCLAESPAITGLLTDGCRNAAEGTCVCCGTCESVSEVGII